MKVVVIGGTGLIGSQLVTQLRGNGHTAIAAAPSLGIDTLTGEGLADALAGTQAVVDLTNPKSFEDGAIMEFFERSGRNVLTAAAAAGVRHHIALSVVGTDRLRDSGYLRGKLAQEALIAKSGLPYTIIRSTQFFEFLTSIAQFGTIGQTVRLSPALVQPIAAADVADAIAGIAIGAPLGGIIEIAGPEAARLSDMVAGFLSATNDPREVIADPDARYFGAKLNPQSLMPGPDARLGSTWLAAWIGQQQIS